MIQLRTYIWGLVGLILIILLAWVISPWLLPLLIPAYLFALLVLAAFDIRTYFIGLFAVAQNPRSYIANTNLLTQKLPFYVRPFADYFVKRFADGDYDEAIRRYRNVVAHRMKRK